MKYGGIDSKDFITGWKYAAEVLPCDDPNLKKEVYSYRDKESGPEIPFIWSRLLVMPII